MTDFQEVQARLSAVDPKLFLGHLCWYSVSEVTIKHSDLIVALHKCGLQDWPRPPSDVDIFRRVCSAAERKRVPGPNNSIENYLVRDPQPDTARVYKVVVRERVDKSGLTYKTEMCKAAFVRATGMLEITAEPDVTAQAIAADIKQNYAVEKGTINSYGLRELIRKVLTKVNATNVRGKSGGVYFVSQEHAQVVENLVKLSEEIPGVIMIHSLPLIDDGRQRAMLRHAYEAETVEEAQRLVNDMLKIKTEAKAGKRRVTADTLTRFKDDIRQRQTKAKEMKGLLQTTLDTADAQITILKDEFAELWTLAE